MNTPSTTTTATAGRFGPFGGQYVPETLMAAIHQLDEAYTAEAAGQIIATYDWIIENGAPHYWLRRGGLAFDGQEHLVYERLVCPVLGQSGDIDHLFGIITFVTGPTGKPEVAERPVGRKISISRVEGLSVIGY